MIGIVLILKNQFLNNGFHEAGFLKLNCDKLKKVYGWKPVYDIKKAVEETAKWYKAYDAGEDMEEVTKNQIKEFFTWQNYCLIL